MKRFGLLPTVSRYVVGEFLRALGIALGFFVILYLTIDFFERLPRFLKHSPPVGLMMEYFLLKIPLIVTQMIPVAVLAASLFGLGTLAKNAELMAMRAGGISLWQISAPIALLCFLLSLGALAWNELVVPAATARTAIIEDVEIKGRELRTHLGRSGLWYHHTTGITNIQQVDASGQLLTGITIYEIDPEFRLLGIQTTPLAWWVEGQWMTEQASLITFERNGGVQNQTLGPRVLDLSESPEDFNAVARDAEDQTFNRLANDIRELRAKGIDTTGMQVDLWMKTSIPFTGFVMCLIGIPLASRHSRSSSLAANTGIAMLVGFSYWIVLALSLSLGRSGVLPPALAAWTANAIFMGIGVVFFLGSE